MIYSNAFSRNILEFILTPFSRKLSLQGSNWQQAIKRLAPNRQQANNWTDNDMVHWRIKALSYLHAILKCHHSPSNKVYDTKYLDKIVIKSFAYEVDSTKNVSFLFFHGIYILGAFYLRASLYLTQHSLVLLATHSRDLHTRLTS